MTCPSNLVGLWWVITRFILASRGCRASLHYLSVVSGSLQDAVKFPARERIIEGTCILHMTTRKNDCNLS